jgi:hypothetical protein
LFLTQTRMRGVARNRREQFQWALTYVLCAAIIIMAIERWGERNAVAATEPDDIAVVF